MRKTPDLEPNQSRFGNLHPRILIGTASDGYAGRIGQAYSDGRCEKGITRKWGQAKVAKY